MLVMTNETINGANDYWGMNPSVNNGYPFLSYQGYQNSYATPAGDGTVANPYQIHSLLDLQWLSEMSSSWDKHFIQTADIDASSASDLDEGAGFIPIGNHDSNFTGSYNGNDYTIYNLYINRLADNYIGLFGRTNTADLLKLAL